MEEIVSTIVLTAGKGYVVLSIILTIIFIAQGKLHKTNPDDCPKYYSFVGFGAAMFFLLSLCFGFADMLKYILPTTLSEPSIYLIALLLAVMTIMYISRLIDEVRK